MILGVEIALAIMGIMALIRGRMQMTGSKVVVGGAARAMGFLALTPVPIATAVALGWMATVNPPDPERFFQDNLKITAAIEAGVVIGMVVLLVLLGSLLGKRPEELAREQQERERDDF